MWKNNKRFGNRRKLVFHGSCLMCGKQDKCSKRNCDGFIRKVN